MNSILKFIIYLSLILYPLYTKAQKEFVFVDESNQKPIPFIVVSSVNTNYYQLTDEMGRLSISENDTGIFSLSHLSYITKLVDFKTKTDTISLKLNPYLLDEVSIKPIVSFETQKKGYLELNSFGFNWHSISSPKRKIAVFIPGSTSPKRIKNILYSVRIPKGDFVLESSLFEVGKDNSPGDLIISKAIEVSRKPKKNILVVPIEGENIELDERGVFVSISVMKAYKVEYKNQNNPTLNEIKKSIQLNMTSKLEESLTFIQVNGVWTKLEFNDGIETVNGRVGLEVVKNKF